MASNRKRMLAIVAAASMAVSLAACGSSSTGNTKSGSSGGTLYYMIFKPLEHVDPQRVYVGRDISNFGRTVYRSLVSFPISTDPDVANKPTPDLATDSGTASDGAKTWSFTIKDGVKWQDGKAITCADFKYGASRVFATDVITGGPNYILTYLDVPTDPKTGLPTYDGPYKKDNQAAFDKAITCSGKTITYHFKKPWADFNLAVAALRMMDPYRADKDNGDKSNFQIFSNGPYKLQGAWAKEKGATFVRNPNYDAKTDSPNLRKALPDKIVWEIGSPTETIYDRLIADAGNDKDAVTSQSVPPAYYSRINGAVASRTVNVESPFVDYVLPNMNRLKDIRIRQALLDSTDVTSWITAGGGSKAYTPAKSIVNPAVVGYQDNPSFKAPEGGDPAAAKKLLQSAGAQTPYPIKFTYPSSETADKQAAALKQGWEKAGFKVTLDGLTDTYYDVIQKPTSDSDLIWGGWGSDWPSAITVTAPLFDSRPNGVGVKGATSNGQDYGNYKSNAFNALVDQAQAATSLADQTAALQKADDQLGKDVAYIPLEITKFYMTRGSNITGYTTDPASAMYPDLGPIGVK
jgi:peptide/nickel transport system substrate-binding protein